MERIEDWYIYNEYDNFLREINFLYNEYENKIKDLYKTPDDEANEYINYLENNPSEYSYIIDEEDVLPEIQYLAFQRYNSIKNIKYRYLCMNIIVFYQMLEQFFSSIIKSRISLSMDKDLVKKYKKTVFYLNEISSFYTEDYNYNFKDNNFYEIINELRLVENTIKHGEGSSSKELEKINDKYFKKIRNNYLYNTIIDDNLNINEEDFVRFYNGIKNFINEMPKHFEHRYNI